jgi:small subunit ribosomal protein S9
MADLSSLKDLASATESQAPVHVRKVDAQGRSYAIGRRKGVVVRV